MAAFDRLSGALAYQIANTLGWRELRPVQDQTIEAVLDGKNAVVLAPTAGGKTEAAFFPLLSQMDAQDWKPVSVLYLSPIRALLNNQEDRVQRLAGMVGRRAFKWHGDVGQGERKRFIADPTDALLITPESLESMLMSSWVPAHALFEGLQAIIIDEVHAFADDDRGAHLASVLERLMRFCKRDVQRLGLSATVGNPEEILAWLRGSSEREGVVVDPGGARKEAALALDYVGAMENAADVIQRLHPGKKRLVFVDSRGKAEKIGNLLNESDTMTFVAHGSLSITARREAESAFAEGRDCVIVATSAMELGIDVGDLDHVLQIDAPPSVASFLQRMGRTGRRAETTPNCTFLVTDEMKVLAAAAILRLFREGYVEPVRPSRRASHIFAHQVMTLGIQVDGVLRQDVDYWLGKATPFADLTAEDRTAIIDHMLEKEILSDQGGKLWLGPEGEKQFGRAHFRELYAVFEVPRLVTVRASHEEIGVVEAQFLQSIDSDDKPGSFKLAGKAWEILHIDWRRAVCTVRPAPKGRTPRWVGEPRHLSYELCQAMRAVLTETSVDPAWSRRAQEVMTSLRADYTFLSDGPAPMVDTHDRITWWTFAGGGANTLLGRMLEKELGEKVIASNTSIKLEGDAARSGAAVRELLRTWGAEGRPTAGDARQFAEGAARSRLSKFQVCLPEAYYLDLVVEKAVDLAGAKRVVGTAD
ncbi:MAG: DEAD/DEAH box helicase [Polyangiaceae bacterium]